ncbi:MAG: hypothetical protein M3418_07895 [Gemmatimonadota bacterium]|nr:hypothetical protein [Gemmatimonadota bacterium]
MLLLLLLAVLMATPVASHAQARATEGYADRMRSLLPATSCHTVTSAQGDPPKEEILWWRDPATAPTLGRWCAAVGGAVVHAEPAMEHADGEEGIDSVVVVSWNTHVGGGELERLVEDLREGRLTDGQPVRHFVLLLQEAPRAGQPVPEMLPEGARAGRAFHEQPGSRERFYIDRIARDLGLALYYVPSMRNGRLQEDWGNALLSTLPLSDFAALELPFESRRRVAAAAVVEGMTTAGVPWRLRLSSAHLDVWSRRGLLSTAGGGRLRQTRALVDALGQDSTATVLGGDFNTWSPREPSLSHLRQHFPDSPPGERKRTHATTGRRLDYLFFRLPECWTARYHRLDDRYGSDHHPLLGWVRMAGCSAEVEAG